MAKIKYIGNLKPLIVLNVKGGSYPDSVGTLLGHAPSKYKIANESLYYLSITGKKGTDKIKLSRDSNKSRNFNSDKNTYTVDSIKTADLNKLIDVAGVTWSMDIKFWYKPFFYELLKELADKDASIGNFAYIKKGGTGRTPKENRILKTVDYKQIKTAKKSTFYAKFHKNVFKKANAIKATLSSIDDKSTVGKTGEVTLTFSIDLSDLTIASSQELLMRLIAMDYSKLIKWGNKLSNKNEKWKKIEARMTAKQKKFIFKWRQNILLYMANYISTNKGKTIADKIANKVKNETNANLSTKLRNEIDDYLITANHWASRRESKKTEFFQHAMSEVFGTILARGIIASPVIMLRYFRDFYKLIKWSDNSKLEMFRNLILCFGVGHCGEHGFLSTMLLKAAKAKGTANPDSIIYVGQANVDHEFVVFGVDLKEVVRVKPVTKKKFYDSLGVSVIPCFDMDKLLKDNKPKDGYVLDPYLDPSSTKRKLSTLLSKLNSSKRSNKTKYLRLNMELPLAITVKNPEPAAPIVVPNV